MAYNGFPATYQPVYYPQQQYQYQPVTPSQNAPQQTNGIIWVQGEAAARSYLLAPNTTLPLWDSESNTIYLKTTDAAGMPSMRVLDYTIRSQTASNAPKTLSEQTAGDLSVYASKNDLEAIQARLNELQKQIDGLTSKKTAKGDKEA